MRTAPARAVSLDFAILHHHAERGARRNQQRREDGLRVPDHIFYCDGQWRSRLATPIGEVMMRRAWRNLSISVVIAWMAVGAMTPGIQAQEGEFVPVTDAMILNPDPSDWINWRRTLDSWGYSPLEQITRDNVGQLSLVWSWAMEPGYNNATPLVYRGVMYLPNQNGVVQALDAADGELLWEYRRDPPISPRRNIAIYDDKIILHTSDAHVIALDAQTGEVAWDVTVGGIKKTSGYSSGGIIVNGKIVNGMAFCERYEDENCFVTAHDARTGREVWRTSLVAGPGEPGGDTWGDLPLVFRAGGESWVPASYDPMTNLIYLGTAQAKPWARVARETDGDALYTNSTLALNPDTGEIVWHHQHIPGETHDFDEVFERVLVDNGDQRSVFSMGKIAVLWELDRETGRFLSAHDLGYQNVVEINHETGQVRYRPEVIQEADVPNEYCPGNGGLRNIYATAYHPETHALYIPMSLTCQLALFGAGELVEDGGGVGQQQRRVQPHPKSPDLVGAFVALDVRTGNVLWKQQTRAPYDTAALTTAGGLVFVGDWNRHFYAFDAFDGTLLWRTRTPASAQGAPITYAVDGRQYLAVPSGTGGNSWSSGNPANLLRDLRRPASGSGNAVLVFALPAAP